MPKEGNCHGGRGTLGLNGTFPDIFKVKLEEMGISAILTAYGEMVASDRKIVGTGDVTISARSFCAKLPQIVTADAGVKPFCTHLHGARNKDTGSTTVIADHLCLGPHCFDDLVHLFAAVVAGRTVSGENEFFTHTGYYSGDFL